MTIKKFSYVSVSSIEEAEKILTEAKENIKALAGGTDLLGTLKDKIHAESPEIIVGLKSIPGLNYIKEDKDGLSIGALTTLDEIAKNELINEKFKALAEAARSVASPQLRNMGTIAGNICQEPRCWYYRAPGDYFHCIRKGGTTCNALIGDNRYHSIFGGSRVAEPSCSVACPGNIAIPVYMEAIREGDRDRAAQILLTNNPMPAVTGRICPHFCESECNRFQYDESVSINRVERILGDYALEQASKFMSPPKKQLKTKVAVIGSGPAGLSASYYLRKEGFQVTVFDQMPEAGGMLTYGIPEYRLSKEIVKNLIKHYEAMGIHFKLNTPIGKGTLTLDSLKKEFKYVVLATGAWQQPTLKIENSDLLESGLDFLIEIGRRETPAVGEKVLVIGGGNVAVDVARSAKRMGAREVTIVYRRTREEMPALEEEIEPALTEGVKLLTSLAPSRIFEKDGKITGVEFVASTSEFGDRRSRLILDYTKKQTLEADQVFLAIGQATNLAYTDGKVEVSKGLIVVENETGKTNVEGIYACGDVTSGPASVIEALATGRKVAQAISNKVPEIQQTTGGFVKIPLDSQKKSMRLENIYEQKHMVQEASRCLNCACVAVNASDIAHVLVALDAKIITTKRILNAEEFFGVVVNGTTVLEADELVKEIKIPAGASTGKQGYIKFRIRNTIDFPIVSLAYAFDINSETISGAKIVLGSVAPVPLRIKAVEEFLEGKQANLETAVNAGDIAVQGIQALSKNKYKVQIVRALLKKMLM